MNKEDAMLLAQFNANQAQVAADEIERLECELSECQAQCAAMRGALEFYADPYEFQLALGRTPEGDKSADWEQVPDFYDECDFGSRAQDTLSPAAGQKVLAVVRAARELVDRGPLDPFSVNITRRLKESIDALGWGP